MDDLIARNRLLKEIREVYEYEFPTASGALDEFVTRIIPNIINNQPTVDAVPVVHGHWVDRQLTDPKNKRVELDRYGLVCSSAYCSVCGEWLVASDEYATFGLYCPHCGAKMDEEGKQDVRSDS